MYFSAISKQNGTHAYDPLDVRMMYLVARKPWGKLPTHAGSVWRSVT